MMKSRLLQELPTDLPRKNYECARFGDELLPDPSLLNPVHQYQDADVDRALSTLEDGAEVQ